MGMRGGGPPLATGGGPIVYDQFTEEHLAFLHTARERPAPPAAEADATPWLLLLLGLADAAGFVIAVLRVPERAAALGADATAIGALVAAFFAAQTASALAWGRLSDRVGRRPVLLAGIAASALSHLLLATAGSLWPLALTRLLHGVGAGTVGVLLAAVTDRSAARARNLGRFGAAASLGGVLGPLAALVAGGDGGVAPEHLAAVLSLGALLLAWRGLPRGRPGREPARSPAADASRTAAAGRRATAPAASPAAGFLLAAYAVAAGVASGVPAMLPLLPAGAGGPGAAAYLAWLGGAGVVLRYLAVGPLAARLGEPRMLALGLASLGAALPLLAVAARPGAVLAALAALALGGALAFPALGALLVAGVPASRRGSRLGAQQAVGGLARALVPLGLGLALRHAWATAAFALAGTLLLALAVRAPAAPPARAVSGLRPRSAVS